MQADTAHELDPRLAADTIRLDDWPLCSVLLMNDRRWPWLILVPRRRGIVELFDLSPADRATLSEESARAAEVLKALTGAQKINVATLGNMVRQFHLHVVARSEGDPNWPGPVWGFGARDPLDPAQAETFRSRLSERLR